jgi:hypothetical protein
MCGRLVGHLDRHQGKGWRVRGAVTLSRPHALGRWGRATTGVALAAIVVCVLTLGVLAII